MKLFYIFAHEHDHTLLFYTEVYLTYIILVSDIWHNDLISACIIEEWSPQ